MIPVQSIPCNMALQEPNTLFLYFGRRFFNSLVRLTEQNKCHGRLSLVDAIMSTSLVSKYSAYWLIPGIQAEYTNYTKGTRGNEGTGR